MADEQINIEVNLKDDASANATVIAERIDNIGDQAAQATRKLAKLKAALVAVDGTSADATVSVKENRSEMDRMGDAAMRADNKIKKSIGGKSGGLFGMINFGFKFKALFSFFKWGAIADGVTLIGSAVAALGGAAVSAVASFTPILGVAGAAPSILGAMAQSMLVLKAGFKGVSEIATPLFEKINSDIEKVIGPSLQKLTKGLLASNGALRNGLVATAKQLKPSIKELDQYLNKGAGKGQLSSFMGNNAEIAGKLGTLATPALKGLFAVIEAATPMTNMLVDKFVSFGNTLSDLAQNNGPAMSRFFDNAGRIFNNTTKTLGDFTKGLYEIGKLSVGLGGEMGFGLMDMMAKFRAWTESAAGQNRIKQFFEEIRAPLQAAWQLLVAVGQAFGRLSVSDKGFSSMTKTFDTLRTSLLPVLEDLAGSLQGEIIPQLATALGSIANILMNLNMAGILGGLLNALEIIANVVGALPGPIQTVIGLMVTLAALVKIIGISLGGWKGGIMGAAKSMTGMTKATAATALAQQAANGTTNNIPGGFMRSGKTQRAGSTKALLGGIAGGALATLFQQQMASDDADSLRKGEEGSDLYKISNQLGGGSAALTKLNVAYKALREKGFSEGMNESARVLEIGIAGQSARPVDIANVMRSGKNPLDKLRSLPFARDNSDVSNENQRSAYQGAANDSGISNVFSKINASNVKELSSGFKEATREMGKTGESWKNFTDNLGQSKAMLAKYGYQLNDVTHDLEDAPGPLKDYASGIRKIDQAWTKQAGTKKGAGEVKQQLSGLVGFAKRSGISIAALTARIPGVGAALKKTGYQLDATTGKITKIDRAAKKKVTKKIDVIANLNKWAKASSKIGSDIEKLKRKRTKMSISPNLKPGALAKIDGQISKKKAAQTKVDAKIELALKKVDEFNKQVEAGNPPKVKVDANTDLATAAVSSWIASNDNQRITVWLDEKPGTKARFTGGPIFAGDRSWVGELGPEMFVRPGMAPEMIGVNGPTIMDFHSDGMIIPNHMLPEEATAGSVRSAPMQVSSSIHTGGGGAGNAINIANVNMTQEMDLTRELVRAQRAMERDKRERAIRPINGRRG